MNKMICAFFQFPHFDKHTLVLPESLLFHTQLTIASLVTLTFNIRVIDLRVSFMV